MSRKQAQRARRNYNRLSRFYDLFTAAEAGLTRTGVGLLAPGPAESVLEIGFGTGRALVELARLVGPHGRVAGIDVSDRMCRVASRRLKRAGLLDRVRLVRGDAASLPFSGGSFEAVFASFVLELFSDMELRAVLTECCRVLTPDGRLGIVCLSLDRDTIPALLYDRLHRLLPFYVDCRRIPLEAALAAAGLRVAKRLSRSAWGLPVEVALAFRR